MIGHRAWAAGVLASITLTTSWGLAAPDVSGGGPDVPSTHLAFDAALRSVLAQGLAFGGIGLLAGVVAWRTLGRAVDRSVPAPTPDRRLGISVLVVTSVLFSAAYASLDWHVGIVSDDAFVVVPARTALVFVLGLATMASAWSATALIGAWATSRTGADRPRAQTAR